MSVTIKESVKSDVARILSALKAVGIKGPDIRRAGPTTIVFWQGEGGGASVSVREGENWEVRMWTGKFDPNHRNTDTDVLKTPKDVARYFAMAGNGGSLRGKYKAMSEQGKSMDIQKQIALIDGLIEGSRNKNYDVSALDIYQDATTSLSAGIHNLWISLPSDEESRRVVLATWIDMLELDLKEIEKAIKGAKKTLKQMG